MIEPISTQVIPRDRHAFFFAVLGIIAGSIENLAIVVTTQNLFSHAERGLAMVAAPEEILFESTAAGLFVVDVSLERARAMRASSDILRISPCGVTICAVSV